MTVSEPTTTETDFTMEDAQTLIAEGGNCVTAGVHNALSLHVQARFVESAFEGLDEALIAKIQDAYGQYATPGSACIDLRYVGNESLTLKPGEQAMVSTGLAIYLADPRLVGKVYPRSGRGSEGLVLGNLTGIIDSDYQNEIKLCLWNRQQLSHAPTSSKFEDYCKKCITIEPGERIAQYLIIERLPFTLNMVEEFDTQTARGLNGFGHSGRF